MATPASYAVGEIVEYQGKYCLIDHISVSKLGFNVYKLQDLDSGATTVAYKHQLSKTGDLDFHDFEFDSFEFEEGESEAQSVIMNHPDPIITKNVDPGKSQRFASLTSDEVDAIASARLSANTKEQTRWGVRIFAGQ